ncbi:hypothetical protein [Aridibaculum aurantiacum]|uniref:hypothetical protein n=1 Tax=Aridibaculum aurantiacum TaxID=2810307 RepID=UPI001A977CD9|nr:hypothetical protein [Aridibaculum aurantiacum]
MKRNRIVWTSIAGVILVAAVADAVRYLQPEAKPKQQVLPAATFPVSSATEIILVYNAYGGIYPSIADFINKEFFPASYPCNLCYITFGTFAMKDDWKTFLDSTGLKKKEMHKDYFNRNYLPTDFALPAILVSDGQRTQVLVSAQEVNGYKTLEQLKQAVAAKLTK